MKALWTLLALCLAVPMYAQTLSADRLPSLEMLRDETEQIAADITTTLVGKQWKEVGNWDNRGFGNDLDYTLLDETYVSEIIVFEANGTYARYACESMSVEKGRLNTRGKWSVGDGWITMVDDTGDSNKSRLIKVTDDLLVFDLMNRYRTTYIPVP